MKRHISFFAPFKDSTILDRRLHNLFRNQYSSWLFQLNKFDAEEQKIWIARAIKFYIFLTKQKPKLAIAVDGFPTVINSIKQIR